MYCYLLFLIDRVDIELPKRLIFCKVIVVHEVETLLLFPVCSQTFAIMELILGTFWRIDGNFIAYTTRIPKALGVIE